MVTTYIIHTVTIQPVQAHLEHLPHYNGGESRIGYGDRVTFLALDPDYGTTDYPTKITFSIQDFDGNDVYNLFTMVEIYDSITGKRVHAYPWTFRDTGDFDLYYQFPHSRGYQIVLSIANNRSETSLYSLSSLDPPRSILNDISNCDCTRTVFNISVANTFGIIQNSVFAVCIISPLALLGIILTKNYYKKYRGIQSKDRLRNYEASTLKTTEIRNIDVGRKQILKYSLSLLALAGGMVHLVVFPEHGSLQVYYSIFLLSAAGGQLAYGILYFLTVLSKPFYEIPIEQLQDVKTVYRYNMALNLFGLIGTAVLVCLYIYVLFYPPPLSPTGHPEELEIAGILAKSVEIVLLIGISVIIRSDRRTFHNLLIRASSY